MNAFKVWGAITLLAIAGVAGAQERPYTEGPVVAVTSVKVMDVQSEQYMKFLYGTYKPSTEASKTAGRILDYSSCRPPPRRP